MEANLTESLNCRRLALSAIPEAIVRMLMKSCLLDLNSEAFGHSQYDAIVKTCHVFYTFGHHLCWIEMIA